MLISCRYGGSEYPCMEIFNSILTDEGLCCIFNGVHEEFLVKDEFRYHDKSVNLLGLKTENKLLKVKLISREENRDISIVVRNSLLRGTIGHQKEDFPRAFSQQAHQDLPLVMIFLLYLGEF